MLVYINDYDTTYNPAMPIVEIKIGTVATLPTLDLKALVDSGSDGTIIPLTYLKQIGARKYQKKWIRTITGQRAQIDLYLISIQIGTTQRARLAVAGDPQLDEAIIGRDLLNQFVVTLDGLASAVLISD
ncbi:MAG: retroviral-like aspartic protease family protein [Chloroflexi bacterium]|nr:retroviral-like aspartic protease family protein [Chloroflexota bacterium]